MTSFAQCGFELCFETCEDLVQKLSEVDITVPARTKGRRSQHRERYAIVKYLIALKQGSLLRFPMRVVKSESPDFLLFPPDGSTLGLEITEAASERSQRASTQLERSPPGTLLEGEDGIRLPGEPLRDQGYSGDEAERKLAAILCRAVVTKVRLLNRPHFQALDSCSLLIYDNSHLAPLTSLAEARSHIRISLHALDVTAAGPRRFNSIAILRDRELLYDCACTASLLRAHFA